MFQIISIAFSITAMWLLCRDTHHESQLFLQKPEIVSFIDMANRYPGGEIPWLRSMIQCNIFWNDAEKQTWNLLLQFIATMDPNTLRAQMNNDLVDESFPDETLENKVLRLATVTDMVLYKPSLSLMYVYWKEGIEAVFRMAFPFAFFEERLAFLRSALEKGRRMLEVLYAFPSTAHTVFYFLYFLARKGFEFMVIFISILYSLYSFRTSVSHSTVFRFSKINMLSSSTCSGRN